MHKLIHLLFLSLASLALPAYADRYAMPKSPAFQEECGSCHIAYPPQMLDSDSWRAVMGGLQKHFGVDASLDAKRRAEITDLLVQNSGRRTTSDAAGRPLLRISETAHFVKEHREIDAATWKRPAIKSASNCAACHQKAVDGAFSERDIRIPR